MFEEGCIEEEVDERFFKINISDATAKAAMLQAATKRARTIADKHRETRARRSELRSLLSGEPVQVGYFKTGVNRGAVLLRQAMNALHRGVGTDDVSGDPLKGEMVLAARKLELEFFEKMGVYTRVTRAEAHASGKGKIIQGRWIDVTRAAQKFLTIDLDMSGRSSTEDKLPHRIFMPPRHPLKLLSSL